MAFDMRGAKNQDRPFLPIRVLLAPGSVALVWIIVWVMRVKSSRRARMSAFKASRRDVGVLQPTAGPTPPPPSLSPPPALAAAAAATGARTEAVFRCRACNEKNVRIRFASGSHAG